MRSRKTLIALVLVAAVTALLVAGTALAQTPPSSDQEARTNYHELFLGRLADLLGVSRESLDGAIVQARNDTADQAVQDGRITQEQADRIKAREGIGRFGFGGPKLGHMGQGAFLIGGEVLDAVAQALGMTRQELLAELRSGKAPAELIEGNEEAVRAAVVDVAKDRLNQAVAAGRITQEQADRMLERMENLDLSQLGRLGGGNWPGMKGSRDWSGLRERMERFRELRPSGGAARFGVGAL